MSKEENAVNEALSESFHAAEALLFERFAEITLQSLYERFRTDMAAVRASLGSTQQLA